MNLYNLALGNGFLDITRNMQVTKEKTDKLDFIKIKNFVLQRMPLRKLKKKQIIENICKSCI